MKKLLTLTAVGTLLAVPAMAVVQCVALDPSTTEITSASAHGSLDWTAELVTNGTSLQVRGVAACVGLSSNQTMGSTATTLTAKTAEIGVWCKIVSPIESHWVYQSADLGDGGCAYNCAKAIYSIPPFQKAMLDSISN